MPAPATPSLAADCIIRLTHRPDRVVLIERRNPPYGLALPGGFVDIGERVEAAAKREMREEVMLDVELDCLLGCYSDPTRDPRGHTVSLVYLATATGEPHPADDAKTVVLADPKDRELILAFDHRLILDDYLHYQSTGELPPMRV